jgi:hypothetical protein
LLEQGSTLLSKKKICSIKHREVSCIFFNA